MRSDELDCVLWIMEKKQYDSALAMLDSALVENPKDVDALTLSGFVSLHANDVSLAKSFFLEAVS